MNSKAADIDCLTQSQARAKYPGKWLYWHGPNRCWDDRNLRMAPNKYSVNRNPLQLGKPPVDASGNTVHHSGAPIIPSKNIFYPELMPGPGTEDSMLQPDTMQTWPLVADFDSEPPQFLPWQQRFVRMP